MNWETQANAFAAAAPQAVWDVLVDGRRWSAWNPGVEWMWFEGEPKRGTLVTIKLQRVRQTAFTIDEIDAPLVFAIGLTVGPVARLRLSWRLTPEAGGTRVVAHIAIGGIAAGFLLRRAALRIGSALPASLERLAQRAAAAR